MIWNRLCGEPWAITENALNTINSIARRENENIEAVSAKLGRSLDNSFDTKLRDNIAVLSVSGPLFRYANVFTKVSGATSYELLAKDFNSALENPDIKAILLDIDSPGGEVNGCAEFASMVYEARNKKQVYAYVSGDAASGAYWIASACEKIFVSETSALGSIGVVAMYKGAKDDNSVEIVSSQSPFKRLDPKSDEGRALIQTRIDAMADVFINSVAKHRGVDPPKVKESFGGGDLFIGEHAVKSGLADQISSFEKTLQTLIKQTSPATEQGFLVSGKEKISMNKNEDGNAHHDKLDINALEKDHPDLVASIESRAHAKGFDEGLKKGIAQGCENERERIGAIIGCDEANRRDKLARHLAFATDMSPDVAKATLSSAPITIVHAPLAGESGFEKAMASIENPSIDTSGEDELEDSVEAIAQRIASGGV